LEEKKRNYSAQENLLNELISAFLHNITNDSEMLNKVKVNIVNQSKWGK